LILIAPLVAPIVTPVAILVAVLIPVLVTRLIAALIAVLIILIRVGLIARIRIVATLAIAVLAIVVLAIVVLATVILAVVVLALIALALTVATLLLAALFGLAVHLGLRFGQHAGVMLGVLQKVLSRHAVTAQLGVARQQLIFIDDLLRGATHLAFGARAVENAVDDIPERPGPVLFRALALVRWSHKGSFRP
jgi:hypothetical protein